MTFQFLDGKTVGFDVGLVRFDVYSYLRVLQSIHIYIYINMAFK